MGCLCPKWRLTPTNKSLKKQTKTNPIKVDSIDRAGLGSGSFCGTVAELTPSPVSQVAHTQSRDKNSAGFAYLLWGFSKVTARHACTWYKQLSTPWPLY